MLWIAITEICFNCTVDTTKIIPLSIITETIINNVKTSTKNTYIKNKGNTLRKWKKTLFIYRKPLNLLF